MAKFTQELFDTICERIARGESLRSICAGEAMPNKSTVMRWLAADGTLCDQYVRAREMQADTFIDECVDIADELARGPIDGQPVPNLTHEKIQLARLQIDTRKWVAGKMRPKKYGDRTQMAITGADDGPVKSTIEITVVRPEPQQ